MKSISIKLKQEQIKFVSVPSECSQKDFVKKSGGDKALHLVVLPFPICSMIISNQDSGKCLFGIEDITRNQDSVIFG